MDKQQRLLTILILARELPWITADGQRGEAEDEYGWMSDTSILCTCGRNLANQPMTKSQCSHMLLRVKRIYSIMMLVLIFPCKNL